LYVDDDLLKGESRASCTTYRPGYVTKITEINFV
jgi:hypothetical protein